MFKRIMTISMVLVLMAGGITFAGGSQEASPEPTAPVVEAPAVVEEAVPETAPAVEAPVEVEKSAVVDTVNVRLAVFKGPTGFGFAKLIEDGPDLVDGVSVETEILPTPTEAIARLTSGDVDVVAMPVNAAAAIYNKGVDVKLAAITGQGMLYILSSSDDVNANLYSFKGKTIHVPGAGSTPEYVPKYIFEKNGLTVGEDVEFDLSLRVASQLAQMLIAGKVENAVLPEPFATMASMKNPKVKRVVDLQTAWSKLSGQDNYPMTAMLVRGKFAAEHPEVVQIMKKAAQSSIEWVNANPAEAASLIEKHGILSAALAQPAIPNCNLIYIDAVEAKASIEAYLSVLKEYAPASIGGSLPDEAFYLAK